MRVLYFTRDFTPHDYRFLISLAESGQEVYFLRLERRGRQLEDRSLPPEVRQVAWRGGQYPFRWRDVPMLLFSLRRVIRDVQPDILHAGPVQTAAFLAALSGFRPLVTMSWGSDLLRDADQSAWYRRLTRYTLSHSTVLAGDCTAVREKAAEFGFPRERAFLFPWGIDLQRFAPGEASPLLLQRPLRERLGWQDCFTVLSLRSWEPVYGVDVMLRGFARAADTDPTLRLLMLGNGSQAGLVHQIIEEHNLRDRVYLGGQVPQADLPDIYRAADLYASASHSDGSSVSLMEALASGLPVLVSDIPGNREWMTGAEGRLLAGGDDDALARAEQGWLFADGDSDALAQGILRAAQMARSDREALARMRRSARERAEQRADWSKNFQVLLQAYQAARDLSQRKAD